MQRSFLWGCGIGPELPSSDVVQQHQQLLEPVRNADSLVPSTGSDTVGVGPDDLCLNKPSRWFGCTLKFENHTNFSLT